jgi:hypothetical protein
MNTMQIEMKENWGREKSIDRKLATEFRFLAPRCGEIVRIPPKLW